MNVSIGSRNESFAQYSTSLDVFESYQEFMNQWGPAGGSRLTLQVPEGISNVTFNNTGSSTGIEISEVAFTEGPANTSGFEEYVNRTSQTLNSFGRVLHGERQIRCIMGTPVVKLFCQTPKAAS